MKTTRTITRILMCCLCASLILSLNLFTTPANAAQTTSEFDFSAEDSIDKYDTYKKLELKIEGKEPLIYVDAPMLNAVRSDDQGIYTPGFYRYGAYLRNSEELQRYGFFNLDWQRNFTTMCNNTLTIFADPEVKFEVKNASGETVVDTSGVQKSTLVNYYNKSTDYGHNVYYIELVPAETSQGQYMVEFKTNSTTTQPHYSFWYGAPLTRKKTALIGNFAVDVTSPNRSSAAVPISIYSLPKRAWVNTITIKKQSTSGDSYVSSVSLNVMAPGAKSPITAQNAASSPLVFNDFPSNILSHDARGTYKVSISHVSWKSPTRIYTYLYSGVLSVEYLYAFGA